eukprot:CAMPEP_0174255938 /NCGR_PEP_ID=MMETSP0439-20130205/5214_1 /TAXON_ID=0 /ORGANISM="Stereomyxa ramosa, Strain Chinc5" /LENGTH=260 /DNA_ID=CAMNT_0015338327 /DNA_START=18 /DNA_END=800 /DNA_ORIENTATION=-
MSGKYDESGDAAESLLGDEQTQEGNLSRPKSRDLDAELDKESRKCWHCQRKFKRWFAFDFNDVDDLSLRQITRVSFYKVFVLCVMYIVNFLGLLLVVMTDENGLWSNFVSCFVSLLYVFVGSVFSYFTFYTLFSATVNKQATKFVMWGCLYGVQGLFCLFLTFGVPATGASGFGTAIRTYQDKDTVVATVQLLNGIGWIIMVVAHVVLFIITRKRFKKAKGSWDILDELSSPFQDEEGVLFGDSLLYTSEDDNKQFSDSD